MPRNSLTSRKQQPETHLPNSGTTHSITPLAKGLPTQPTLLLVDDDLAVRKGLGRVLAAEGWRVVSAANGEEALERLAELQPDLMITDLRMVGVSGWDLLFHVNMQRPNLPIFVITALPPAAIGGADHFAAEFFPKPLDLDALVMAIRRRLGVTQAMQPQQQ